MGSQGGGRTDLADVVRSRGGTTTLVVGANGHADACGRLARAGPGRAYRVRMAADADPCADTDDLYETSVYDGLPVPNAGIAVSDTVGNLRQDDPPLDDGALVVCVDGLPAPADREDRRRLFQFLHAITHRVRAVDGHCHVHLPVDAAARAAEVMAPLFDHVVDAGASSP